MSFQRAHIPQSLMDVLMGLNNKPKVEPGTIKTEILVSVLPYLVIFLSGYSEPTLFLIMYFLCRRPQLSLQNNFLRLK